MINIQYGIYEPVTIAWSGITLPLKAGTPISAAGAIANSSSAVGLVPQDVTIQPLFPKLNILVGGVVNLAEVNASYGTDLADAAKQAMSGITFYGSDLTPTPDPVYTIPDASASAKGVVKQGAAVADAAGDAPTAAEFKALLDSLRTAGIIATASGS